MNDKMVFLGILLIVLAAGVRATELEGNFTLQASCFEPAKTFYTLTNNTATEHTYTITAVGDNADWIFLGYREGKWIASQPLIITLGAGKSTELVAFVKPQDCYVEPGTYAIKVRVENDEVLEKEIKVNVVSTRALDLSVSPSNVSITQCKETKFELQVKNTGQSNEIVQLFVQGIPSDWFDLPQTEFLLEKGATRNAEIAVKPSCDAVIKTYNFEVVAGVKGTSFKAVKQLSLAITDAQEIQIAAGALRACNDSKTTANMTIKNNGAMEDELQLSASGLDWVSLQQENIMLNAGRVAEIGIAFGKSGADAGTYTFSVKAHSTKFNKDTVAQFNVTVSDCYGVSVESVKINGKAVGAKESACLEENPKYTFSLKNSQEKDIALDVSVEGIDAVINPASLTIAPGNTSEIEVEIDLSNESAGAKEFTLVMESEHFSLKVPFALTAEDCYAIQADYDGLLETIDVNANCKAEPITVLLKNTGTKENSAKAEISGPEWVYAEPVQIVLAVGEEKGLFVYISPPYDVKEGLHKAKLSISAKDFSDEQDIPVNVYGGLYAELGEAKISAEGKLKNLLEEIDKTVEVTLTISNDSNALLRVNDINVLQFYAEDSFQPTTLQPGEKTTAVIKLYLGKDWALDEFTVPVQFITDKGTLTRDVFVDLTPTEAGGQPIAQVGLFSLANAKDALIVAMAAIVIALIAMLAFRASKPKQSATLTTIAEEVQELPAKKLEEIGKKKTRGRKKKVKENKEEEKAEEDKEE